MFTPILTPVTFQECSKVLSANSYSDLARYLAKVNDELRATVENQCHTITEGLASLQASSKSQLRSIGSMRENITYNTDIMANALELAATSQKTAAEAL